RRLFRLGPGQFLDLGGVVAGELPGAAGADPGGAGSARHPRALGTLIRRADDGRASFAPARVVRRCRAMSDAAIDAKVKTAVVVPCYRTGRTVAAVVAGIPDWVDHVIVVDDACPERSGDVAEAIGAPRLTVLRHEVNQG